MMQIKLFWNVWIRNESLQSLAEKASSKQRSESVDLYSSMLMTYRYVMSHASSRCSDAMKIHKC